jgi:hypothetical protein
MKRQFINRDTIGEDLTAGLVLGIQSIPDGLANGLLALINPIYGLYGYMMGTFTGAFFTSSAFMTVQATSAMALVVASVPQITAGSDPNTPLFTLAILTGMFMLAGVEPQVVVQMERTGVLQAIGRDNVFPASEGIEEALLQAIEAGEHWIATVRERGSDSKLFYTAIKVNDERAFKYLS